MAAEIKDDHVFRPRHLADFIDLTADAPQSCFFIDKHCNSARTETPYPRVFQRRCKIMSILGRKVQGWNVRIKKVVYSHDRAHFWRT